MEQMSTDDIYERLGVDREEFKSLSRDEQRKLLQESNLKQKQGRAQEFLAAIKKDPELAQKAQKALEQQQRIEKAQNEPKSFLRQFAVMMEQALNPLHLAQQFILSQPLWYDRAGLWWAWNPERYAWEVIDETDLLIMIDDGLKSGITVKSRTKGEILEALRREARRQNPTPPPLTWVQFHNTIIDIETGSTHTPSPRYFITNPIPWRIGDTTETPNLDKMFAEWVGAEASTTLKEIMAYATLTDYPLARIFVLLGSGSNGKSTYLRVLDKWVGEENAVSTELDLLMANNFAAADLYKKLVAVLGETNFGTMKNTSKLKMLSGNDKIRFEFKGKDAIHDRNYAKLIIATNSLPATYDKTDGFYRRWVIIDFKRKFTEKRDVFNEIPDSEYSAFAAQAVTLLKNLFKNRGFAGEGSVEERRRIYEEKSNPLKAFVDGHCVASADAAVPFGEFYDAFLGYLFAHGHRELTKNAVGSRLSAEGYDRRTVRDGERTYKVIDGLRLKAKRDLQQDLGVVTNRVDDMVLTTIEHLDSGDGAPVDLIANDTGLEDVDSVLNRLETTGDVFQCKPGRYKRL
jgi:P4 family phage/plasmid primase-like protien